MARKYSKVYKSESGNHFRYNYEQCVLEWIDKTVFDQDYNLIPTKDWHVIDCIGLQLENWKDGGEYWVDKYDYEIKCECQY